MTSVLPAPVEEAPSPPDLERGGESDALRGAFQSRPPAAIHPVARVHPETGERVLHRITLAGDVPEGPDGSRSEAISGEVFA